MKIHELGQLTLAERIRHPFAVAYDGEVVRFREVKAAWLYAHLLDNGAQRFIAITEPEYLTDTPIHGWRQVSYFLLPLAEDEEYDPATDPDRDYQYEKENPR